MEENTAEHVSGRQLARILGYAPSYIAKLKKLGVLKQCYDGQGKIDVEVAVREIEASRDPSKQYIRQRWEAYRAGDLLQAGNPAASPASTGSDDGRGDKDVPENDGAATAGATEQNSTLVVPGSGATAADSSRPAAVRPEAGLNVVSFQDAKTQKEIYQAKQAELDYRRRAGELVEKSKVEAAARSTALIVRNGLKQIPDRQAQVLASITDPIRVHEILIAEFDRIMNTFADELLREIDVDIKRPEPRPAGTG